MEVKSKIMQNGSTLILCKMVWIQSSDKIGSMRVVLGEKTESNSSHRIVTPTLVQCLEQRPALLASKLVMTIINADILLDRSLLTTVNVIFAVLIKMMISQLIYALRLLKSLLRY